ncbi:hypothetical protein [Arcanobacterium bovis]|uniref:PH domain-containing protein n=1 Tax=Arcanobacterium bovis TaxID=2529275 RepID=A0A4Q9V200_9ACTO|nr:hypothetical protein [Arcanobacterium bovis]TBW23659.1 hypothetical protein EZJ44_00500 [Arcanobacterium bovis]
MTYVLRGKGTQLYGYALLALAVIITGGSAAHGGWGEALYALPVSACVASLAWLAYGNPRTEVGTQGLRIVNLMRIFDVPWADLDYVENRWGLVVRTKSRRPISAWSIPSRAGVFENSVREAKQVEQDVTWDHDDGARVPLIVSVRRAVLIIENRHLALKAEKKHNGARSNLTNKTAFDTANTVPGDGTLTTTRFNVLPLAALAGSLALTAGLWLSL